MPDRRERVAGVMLFDGQAGPIDGPIRSCGRQRGVGGGAARTRIGKRWLGEEESRDDADGPEPHKHNSGDLTPPAKGVEWREGGGYPPEAEAAGTIACTHDIIALWL
jgi:hypothetical protein